MNAQGTMTRRELLIAGAGLAGTALVAGVVGFGVLASDRVPFARASWVPLVGSNFQVGRQSLRLVAVRDLGSLRYGDRLLAGREHFALDFTGAPDAPLASSLHTLEHPQLGRVEMFLSPVDRPASALTYEAIVNRFEINVGRNHNV
jgi:hypothetical protein